MGRGVVIVGAVVIALSLGGCVEQPAPVESVVPEVVIEYEVGEVLSEEDALALADSSDGRFRAYPMADGTYVLVDSQAPLPESVQQKLNAEMTTIVVSYDPSQGQSGFGEANTAIANDIRINTGKTPITVAYMPVDRTGEGHEMTWIVWFNNRGEYYGSREAAEAAIDAYVEGDPQGYAVVWGA